MKIRYLSLERWSDQSIHSREGKIYSKKERELRKPTLIVTIKSWLSLQPENCNLEFQSQRFSFERCIDVVFFFNGCFNPSIYIYHTRVYFNFPRITSWILNDIKIFYRSYETIRDVIRSKRILAHHSLYIASIISTHNRNQTYPHLILISNRPLSLPPPVLSLSLSPLWPLQGIKVYANCFSGNTSLKQR